MRRSILNLGVPQSVEGKTNKEYKRRYRELNKQHIREYGRAYRRAYRKEGRDKWLNEQKGKKND